MHEKDKLRYEQECQMFSFQALQKGKEKTGNNSKIPHKWSIVLTTTDDIGSGSGEANKSECKRCGGEFDKFGQTLTLTLTQTFCNDSQRWRNQARNSFITDMLNINKTDRTLTHIMCIFVSSAHTFGLNECVACRFRVE